MVNAEVVSTDFASIIREAHEVATWHPNIVVKIPMIPDGVRALSDLSKEGIRINVTLVFSAPQALLVAKAGAYFVSPFLGRLDDSGQDGLVLLREIMEIYRAYNYPTQVSAASLRHPLHVMEAAKMGAHIGTMPYKVFEKLFHHPLTDKGLAGFLKDGRKRAKSSATSCSRPLRAKRALKSAKARRAHLAHAPPPAGRARGAATLRAGGAARVIPKTLSAAAARASIRSAASPKAASSNNGDVCRQLRKARGLARLDASAPGRRSPLTSANWSATATRSPA